MNRRDRGERPLEPWEVGESPVRRLVTRRVPEWFTRSRTAKSYEQLDFYQFIRELKKLGLFGMPFTPELYAQRLMGLLGVEIRLRYIDEIRHPGVLRKLAEEGITGGLIVNPGATKPVAWVIIPESSSPMEELLSAFHELGHLAGLHPITPRRLLHSESGLDSGKVAESWTPPGCLTGRTGPPDHLVEEEAEQRAEYGLLAGLHADRVFARYRWMLGHDPRDEIFQLGA